MMIGRKSSSVILITIVIVAIWLLILGLLIKLDVGGFGSNVMTPILRNVPVVNKILPASESAADESGYEGYSSLQEAVDQIKTLELQLSAATAESQTDETTIAQMQAEIERLKTFENNQLEFQKIKMNFIRKLFMRKKDRAQTNMPSIMSLWIRRQQRRYIKRLSPNSRKRRKTGLCSCIFRNEAKRGSSDL